MKIEVTEEGSKVVVDVEVPHIRGTRKRKKEYLTSDVLEHMEKLGYNVKSLRLVSECRVFNYQTLKRCKGQWVFEDMAKKKKSELLVEFEKRFDDLDSKETKMAQTEPKKKTTRRKKALTKRGPTPRKKKDE